MASSLAKFRHLTKPTPEKMSCPIQPPPKESREEFPVFTKDLYLSKFPIPIRDVRPEDKVEADPRDYLENQIFLGSGRMGQAHLARCRDFTKYASTKVIAPSEENKVVWVRVDSRVVDYIDAVRMREPFVLESTEPSPFICKVLLSFRSRCGNQVLQYDLISEYWKGQKSLCKCLEQAGRLTEDAARFYIMELADALIFIHSFNKIVRRLCTCCLLVKANGHLLLSSYTMCKQNLDCGQACNMLAMNCGDQFYASPEIVFGVDVQIVTDWWSYGVILFQLLTYELPFTGCTLGDLGKCITEAPVEIPEHVSPEATAFIKHLLHKDPRRRLGLGSSGPSDIMKHPFFSGVDWRDVRSMVMTMEPPFKTKTVDNLVTMKDIQTKCKV